MQQKRTGIESIEIGPRTTGSYGDDQVAGAQETGDRVVF
jgi:hypothetical protein